jgi:hypothetical protein
MTEASGNRDLAAELGALGYPGFAHINAHIERKTRRSPAEVLFDALDQSELDARVAERLPWLALIYVDMDWDWLVRNAKLRDRQNRLGFAVSLACEVPEANNDIERTRKLQRQLKSLESARLAHEDTFCHDAMTQVERAGLRGHRSSIAAHWNLMTDMKGEHLAYTST